MDHDEAFRSSAEGSLLNPSLVPSPFSSGDDDKSGPTGQFDSEQPAQIQPGEYDVTYVRHELRNLFGGRVLKLVVWFRIVSPGDGHGVLVPKYYNVQKVDRKARSSIDFRVGFKGAFFRDYVRLLEIRPSRRDRVSPSNFKGKVFRAEIRYVERDSRQQPIAKGAQYSVVERLIGSAL